jgi:hypothetical protein
MYTLACCGDMVMDSKTKYRPDCGVDDRPDTIDDAVAVTLLAKLYVILNVTDVIVTLDDRFK